MTDAEKKAKKKAKKAAGKVQEDPKKGVYCYHNQQLHYPYRAAGATPSANEDKGLEVTPPKDDDPEGIKLLTVTDPLEKAAKILAPLASLALDNIDVCMVTYDVAIRRSESPLWLMSCGGISLILGFRKAAAGRPGISTCTVNRHRAPRTPYPHR